MIFVSGFTCWADYFTDFVTDVLLYGYSTKALNNASPPIMQAELLLAENKKKPLQVCLRRRAVCCVV